MVQSSLYAAPGPTCAPTSPISAGRIVAKGKPATFFLRGISVKDGKQTFQMNLDAPPTFDGWAIAGGKVYLSLQNGSVMCLE